MKDTRFWLREAADFTEAHRAGGESSARELRCLRVQFPAVFEPVGETDLFTGYVSEPIVGYRYSWNSSRGMGYYCDFDRLDAARTDPELSGAEHRTAEELIEYWKTRTTRALWEREQPPREEYFIAGLCEVYPRLAEINLDFDKLLRLGVPGLREEVEACRAKKPLPLYDSLLGALELLADSLRALAREAEDRIPRAATERRRAELRRMAESCAFLAEHAPDSFYGALSLFHVVAMMTTVDNFARMDVYLGDFLVNDLRRGTLTREEALEIFVDLYRRYERLFSTTGRIIIGGEGRRNPENADEMALLILDAAERVHGEAPTLCLRVHDALDPRLWDKAMETLERGCSYPLLFNDAVNVPGRMSAWHVPREDAEQYIMSNCGEYGLWARSVHSPDGAVNYAKVLELTLHGGTDPMTGRRVGPDTGRAEEFGSFEELWEAFRAQSAFFIRKSADRLRSIYSVAAEDSPNLLMSLLYHDCLETGKGLLMGARYRFYDVETHGVVLVADSLLAIRRLVFEEKSVTMPELLDALARDFEGCEALRAKLLRVPKFGNGDAEADGMTRLVSDFVQAETAAQAERLGVQAVTASQITVDNYEVMGRYVLATPDGRKALTPITNSINPSNGSDRCGVFPLLRSMAGVDTSLSGGQVHHLKLAPSAFSPERRAATGAMLRTFFREGGGELSVYTVRQEDLIDAMAHPEAHGDLIVRIGGFNARFVNLSPSLQREMIARNAYT